MLSSFVTFSQYDRLLLSSFVILSHYDRLCCYLVIFSQYDRLLLSSFISFQYDRLLLSSFVTIVFWCYLLVFSRSTIIFPSHLLVVFSQHKPHLLSSLGIFLPVRSSFPVIFR